MPARREGKPRAVARLVIAGYLAPDRSHSRDRRELPLRVRNSAADLAGKISVAAVPAGSLGGGLLRGRKRLPFTIAPISQARLLAMSKKACGDLLRDPRTVWFGGVVEELHKRRERRIS